MEKILIVDDDVAVTNYLMVFLMQTGRFETLVVNDSRQVEDLLAKDSFGVILLDMDMPNVSGMDILKMMHQKGLSIPVIILTGVSDVDLAVKSLKLGAIDYLTKPVEDETLLEAIDTALEHRALHHSIDQLPPQLKREDLTHVDAFEQFPTQNPAMIRFLHQIEKMATSDLTVFIWGEPGPARRCWRAPSRKRARGATGRLWRSMPRDRIRRSFRPTSSGRPASGAGSARSVPASSRRRRMERSFWGRWST